MPAKTSRVAMAVAFLTAAGCQELHSISKIDPLVGPSKSSLDSRLAASGGATPTDSGSPGAASAPSAATVHYVSYAPDPAPAATGSIATAENASLATAGPLADLGATPPASPLSSKPSWLAGNGASGGKSWNDLFVSRGQTPARSVFVSDRTLMGAIVIAAIVIPFAVHDSRQPNPPHQ